MSPKPKFILQLETLWKKGNFVCIGLDPDFGKATFSFNKKIIDSTYDLVCCYKPNIAFYEGYGVDGLLELQKTIKYIKNKYPQIPVILDIKKGDVGHANLFNLKYIFDYFQADAVTINPYPGKEALKPFLEQKDKGIFVWAKSSNPGSDEFQNLKIQKDPLYIVVAKHVAEEWNYNGNCGLIVGATYPKELAVVRKVVGEMPILIPGVGAQGGDLKASVKAGIDSRGLGIIVSSSRGIIFAENPRETAKKLRDEINKYRNL